MKTLGIIGGLSWFSTTVFDTTAIHSKSAVDFALAN